MSSINIGVLATKKVRGDAACQCLHWPPFMSCNVLHFVTTAMQQWPFRWGVVTGVSAMLCCLYMRTVLLQLWVLRHMTNDTVTTPRFQNRHLLSLTEKKTLAFVSKPHHASSSEWQESLCRRRWQRTSDKGSSVFFVIPFRYVCSVVSHVWFLGQSLLLPGAVSGPRINFVNVGGWAEPIWWWRYAGRANCSASPATTQTGGCLRTALREAAESSIAGSRPRRCAGRLFVPCALHHTSHTCYRRPRSLHCDSSLWKGRGGAFCFQGPTMARCHTFWLLVPLLERCQFSPLRQGHGGVPAAKTQPVGSFAWTWHCSQADYQQPSAPSEHSCGHR